MQKITIFAKDSFGAETMVDLNGDDGTAAAPPAPLDHLVKSSLVVEVNAPPRLAQSMPDVFLYRSGQDASGATANVVLSTATKRSSGSFEISDYFAVEYAVAADLSANPQVLGVVNDTTCVFTTDPKQPTGLAAVVADASANPPVAALDADPLKAITLASVIGTFEPATELNSVTVDATPTLITTDPVSVDAAGLGSFTLTITCTDTEKSISDMATITVLP